MRIVAPLGLIAGIAAAPALAETRTYDLSGFTRIEAHDGVEVEVSIAEAFTVEAEALRGDLDRLEVTLRGEALHIERDADWRLFGTGNRDRFRIIVTLPMLEEAQAASGTRMIAAGVIGDLTAVASGGSHLEVTGDLGVVRAEVSGGSHLELTGSCAEIDAEGSGGSRVLAAELACHGATATASGGTRVELTAGGTASLGASGGSSIVLTGGAEVTRAETSGGASIRTR